MLTAKQNRGLLAQGIDVSSAQGSVDWRAAYNAGARFAYVEDQFNGNWTQLLALATNHD